MKFTIEYLDAPQGAVRYATELITDDGAAADVSARIGFRWASKAHNAFCYRVLDEEGEIVATGPYASMVTH